MSDCIKRLMEKSNGVFDKTEAKKLLKDVEAIARKKAKQGFDYDNAIKDTLAEYGSNVKVNLEKQKLNALRNVAKNKGVMKRITDMVASGKLTLQQAIRAEIEGTEAMVKAGRYSADAQAIAVQQSLVSSFVKDLESEGLLELLNSGTLEKEIVNELRILEDGNGKPSGSKEAKRIAEIIQKHKEALRIRANNAGADIDKVNGHTMLQTHGIDDMRKLGRDGWVNLIRPLVDEKITFGGADDLDAALRSAYDAMVTGIRLDNPFKVKNMQFQDVFQPIPDGYFTKTSPSNLGKKLSQSRKIHFKDADSFLQYNEAVGKFGLNDSLIQMFARHGHDIALMERYGTNPEANIKAAVTNLTEKYRGQLADKKLTVSQEKVQSMIDELMGYNAEPDNPNLAKFGSNYRMYQTVLRLGGVVLSSISDIPYKALSYQHHGKSVLSSYVQPFLDLLEGFKSKEEKLQFASLLGVGMESMIGDIAGRFGSNDAISQKAMKLTRTYFKLTGLSWWTDTHKLAMGKVLSHDLALKKALSFDQLDDSTKRIFNSFDIQEKDWNAIRQGIKKMDDGREYVFAQFVEDAAAKDKLSAYYIDSVNHGITTGGQKERRIITLGTQRGTPAGEIIRLMMQFKQFPTTVITRQWGRALYSKGKADVPAMLQLIIMTGAFGYLAGAAKDLTRGKTVKDPTEKATIMAAFAQGGGFSIAGDLAFGQGSLASVAGGPALGQAESVYNVYKAAREGKDAKAKAAKTVIDATVPNLFYIKPALDSLLRAHVYEELNHGYTRRMEQKMKKDYGQEFYIKPN